MVRQIRAMSRQRKLIKQTLANKLAEQSKVIKQNIKLIKEESNVQDIEELVSNKDSPGPNIASPRFLSPLQTRRRRLQNAATSIIQQNIKQELIPQKKIKQEYNRVQKAKNIIVGTSTVTKCGIVPVAELKQSAESDPLPTTIKQEETEQNICEVKVEAASPQKIGTHVPVQESTPNVMWQQQLENIRIMRSKSPAPVDTMGCHQCADNNADEKTQRFHKLVALMLSSQTKDETTYQAMNRLKAGTLTPCRILQISNEELQQLLYPVSFYKNKANYLKKTAQILIDKYNGDIPNDVKELIALPGVGPKMAHICMSTAWGRITGIGVDVHVHRISNRLGWLKKPTKEPEQTRVGLESWLPRDLWAEVNHLFVGFGQTVCKPVKPNCGKCLNKSICPSADKSVAK